MTMHGRQTNGSFRIRHYNATVFDVRRVHETLIVMRVRPDAGFTYRPGQYAILGLSDGEERVDGIRGGLSPCDASKLIRRAYSISNPLLYEGGLANIDRLPFLEFYITLVAYPSDKPPKLSPRLFGLKVGDRLHLGATAHGHYTTDPVGSNDNVWFLGTGTGEAPHNAMVVELLSRGHQGRIVCATSVRYRKDLAYLEAHQHLEANHPTYRYVPITTREPENVDPRHPHFVGKQYLQDWIGSATFLEEFGPIDPARTHVFLCGNPDMIGWPRRDDHGNSVFPERHGLAEHLAEHGFQLDDPNETGNVHSERYW